MLAHILMIYEALYIITCSRSISVHALFFSPSNVLFSLFACVGLSFFSNEIHLE